MNSKFSIILLCLLLFFACDKSEKKKPVTDTDNKTFVRSEPDTVRTSVILFTNPYANQSQILYMQKVYMDTVDFKPVNDSTKIKTPVRDSFYFFINFDTARHNNKTVKWDTATKQPVMEQRWVPIDKKAIKDLNMNWPKLNP